uniref:Uncharacterized protein n=1 Tax=Heterorhabditis bacteriophora TaxID=37862 RepID=A0A1I7WYI2_HETBA
MVLYCTKLLLVQSFRHYITVQRREN